MIRLREDLAGYKDALFKETNEAARLRDDRDRLSEKLREVGLRQQSAPERDGTRASGSPLRVIFVGTGRDGTTSLSRMVEEALDSRGLGETVMHEWAAIELNAAFCNLRETSDPQYATRIREILKDCPHTCVVGNGYAAVLPEIAECLGPQIKLVHLRRLDRQGCAASLAENARSYPVNHKYYAESLDASGKRMAAFHFREMSVEAWTALHLEDKFGWYYDKTHALISENMHLFEQGFDIETEALGEQRVRALIGDVVGARVVPEAVHLNRHVGLQDVLQSQRQFVQRLMGKLDLDRLARDEIYGLKHFVSEYVRYFGQRVLEVDRADPGAMQHLNAVLSSGRAAFDEASSGVAALQDGLSAAGDQARTVG